MLGGDLEQGDNATAERLADLDHLAQQLRAGLHKVVRQQDREGGVAHVGLGLKDRVAQAQGVALAHRMDARVLLVFVHILEGLGLAALFQVGLEAGLGVEVVFDGLLTRAGDKQDILNASVGSLANDVLDRGAVDDGEHLLGDRLGDGQEACSATGRGNDSVHDGLIFI